MSDFFQRLPAWTKALAMAAAIYLAGIGTSQVYTETRTIPAQQRATNSRVDSLRAEVLLVRREQGTQRATVLEAQRLLRYLTCEVRKQADCIGHLTFMDLDRFGGT